MTAERLEVALPDGRVLEAVDEGDPAGMLLILHHGSPGSAVPFPTFDRAAGERGIRLIEYSRAGFGGSSRKAGRSVADAAADTAALADALETDRFIVAGWSGGGPHALACAALLPDRALACATIAGVGPWDGEGLRWLAGMGQDNVVEYSTAARVAHALLEWMRPHVEALSRVDAGGIVEDMRSIISDVDETALTGELGEVIAASFRGAFRGGGWGWYDDDLAFIRSWGFELSSIRVPVAIWQGAHDLMVPFAHGQWLVEHIPSAHPRLHPEHGHLSLAVGMIGEILDDLLALAKGEGPGGAA